MNIRTKIYLTVFVMAVLWLCIVLLNGTYAYAHCVPPDGFLAGMHNYDCPNHTENYGQTPLTPQYPNPNDNPNNPYMQQQNQRAQDQMNQFYYNRQLQQQLQQQQLQNGRAPQQPLIMPMR